eukprot:TRINITY_DN48715_c0_g1_i1.p1 TRINITY_DN48715_c0_g1~~TRINITY_DN48715_c0_g1_i1.p1  ORF type:complete len:169 (-),score=16.61 TRINITY_DN48715_c0_g1_i1:122-628(-)
MHAGLILWHRQTGISYTHHHPTYQSFLSGTCYIPCDDARLRHIFCDRSKNLRLGRDWYIQQQEPPTSDLSAVLAVCQRLQPWSLIAVDQRRETRRKGVVDEDVVVRDPHSGIVIKGKVKNMSFEIEDARRELSAKESRAFWDCKDCPSSCPKHSSCPGLADTFQMNDF